MKTRNIIFICIAIFLPGILGYLAYQQSSFRLVSASPKNEGEQAISNDLEFEFNKTLNQNMKNSFKISPYTDGIISVDNKKLLFHPTSSLQINKVYQVTITNPTSNTGMSIDTILITFTAKYIPFSKTSKSQQQQGINTSDTLEAKYPFISHLPHETNHYKIDYSLVEGSKIQLNVTLYAILNNANQQSLYLSTLKEYKIEADTYLQSLNAKANDYTIKYSPDPNTGN